MKNPEETMDEHPLKSGGAIAFSMELDQIFIYLYNLFDMNKYSLCAAAPYICSH
jgi:hypothetical protein